jgi:hypothetical protein
MGPPAAVFDRGHAVSVDPTADRERSSAVPTSPAARRKRRAGGLKVLTR